MIDNSRLTGEILPVDTGMGRLGVLHSQALGFIKKLNKLSNLEINGLFTHFPSADTDRSFTNYQISLFNSLINKLIEFNIHIPLIHAANSMAVIGYSNSHFNLVRPGLMLFGIYPKKNIDK